ncbi:MAG: hypothetical protein IT371_08630 [Deltaproteobacteria bacterium]|nr:hypothetical protein [Deltaproteobacteria bacterium]
MSSTRAPRLLRHLLLSYAIASVVASGSPATAAPFRGSALEREAYALVNSLASVRNLPVREQYAVVASFARGVAVLKGKVAGERGANYRFLHQTLTRVEQMLSADNRTIGMSPGRCVAFDASTLLGTLQQIALGHPTVERRATAAVRRVERAPATRHLFRQRDALARAYADAVTAAELLMEKNNVGDKAWQRYLSRGNYGGWDSMEDLRDYFQMGQEQWAYGRTGATRAKKALDAFEAKLVRTVPEYAAALEAAKTASSWALGREVVFPQASAMADELTANGLLVTAPKARTARRAK